MSSWGEQHSWTFKRRRLDLSGVDDRPEQTPFYII